MPGPVGSSIRRALRPLLLTAAVCAAWACEDVAVNPLKVVTIELDPETATVGIGQTRRLQVHLYDAAGRELSGYAVHWGTDKPDVVFVEDDGSVVGLRPGIATVTAVAGGASGDAVITVQLRLGPPSARP